MAHHDGFEHGFFGQLLRFRFHHQHGVLRARDHKVEAAFLHLVDGRVELQLALDETNARAADRAHEGHAGNGERSGGGHQRQNVGIVLKIVAEHGDDDLRLVAVALGEQRTDRAVDEAGDQRLLLGGAAFALEITAGNAARCERLFLVVHGQRKEVDAGLGRLGGDDRGEQSGLAPGREDRAVGLARDAARFEGELAPGPFKLFTMDFEHGYVSHGLRAAHTGGAAFAKQTAMGKMARRCRDADASTLWAQARKDFAATASGDPAMAEPLRWNGDPMPPAHSGVLPAQTREER